MNPTELTEEKFNKTKKSGIFYYKKEDYIYCKVIYRDKSQAERNVWKNEKLAFEWMNEFKEYFENN